MNLVQNRGDDAVWRFYVYDADGNPVDLTTATITFTVSELDGTQTFQRTSGAGHIALADGHCDVTIIPANTESLELGRRTYELVVVIDANTLTPAKGDFVLPGDYYVLPSDVDDVFGFNNVRKWADLDGDGVVAHVDRRIQHAIRYAHAQVETAVRNGPADLPLKTNENETPPIVVEAAALLAGVWLYESRGVQDFDPETGKVVHRLAWHRKRATALLSAIRTGRLDVGAEGVTDQGPAVV